MPDSNREALDPHLPPATRMLAACDEILQVMFWLRGEGLATDVGPADLTRWLGMSGEEIQPLLGRLEARGWIETTAQPNRFRLTERGAEEGGRRFSAEFAEVTKPGHGECGDPNCDCRTTGRPEDCKHHRHSHA